MDSWNTQPSTLYLSNCLENSISAKTFHTKLKRAIANNEETTTESPPYQGQRTRQPGSEV